MKIENSLIVHVQMLIRKPVEEVFEAFINPAITTRFWFTKSSGKLVSDKEIRWDWEMFGFSTTVKVKAVEQNKRILIEWDEPPCQVEWIFTACAEGTLVVISNWGFSGSDDEVVAKAIDSKGGFTMVLIGAKALLEHDITLNLIQDQFPDGYPT